MSPIGIILLVFVVLFLFGGGMGHYGGNAYYGNGGLSIGGILFIIFLIWLFTGGLR
jgi:hypothetical protein